MARTLNAYFTKTFPDESLGEMLILTEYCELRDLKTFLVRRRDYFYDELQFSSVTNGTNVTSTAR